MANRAKGPKHAFVVVSASLIGPFVEAWYILTTNQDLTPTRCCQRRMEESGDILTDLEILQDCRICKSVRISRLSGHVIQQRNSEHVIR